MSPPRVAFFGSPDFAVPTLEALIASPYRPVVVVTQPDRPAGRGRALRSPAVKRVATAAGIEVLQPPRLRAAEATAALAGFETDLQVIAAYGQILRPDVLALPRFGTLNVHASILPRWRGAAPVAAAILAGDAQSGVTIMLVDEGEDTGDILRTRVEPIGDRDDAGSLSERLARIGATLLLETIPAWLAGEITPRPQDEAQSTRARRLRKAQGRIDWRQPATEIARQVRAFSPWPGASTSLRDSALRIWRATTRPEGAGAATPGEAIADGRSSGQALAAGSTPGLVLAAGSTPGLVLAAGSTPGLVLAAGSTIEVATGAGVLQIERLQRAGKQALDARAFANGDPGLVGQVLGDRA